MTRTRRIEARREGSRDHLAIRPFRETDEGEVVALWREAFAGDPPWSEPETVIRRKLAVQRELFLVGVLDGRIAAAAVAGYDGFRGWVYHLAVASRERRRGFGKKMMKEVEKKLRALGCPKLNLQVRASNAGVVEFYKRLGYSTENHVSMGKLLE